jgi:hypothetical protein
MDKNRLICHRANLWGADAKRENKIEAIKECISLGFDVEIDLRFYRNKFYLGHDERQESIPFDLLQKLKNKLWIHCKDLEALHELNGSKLNYFWHDKDQYTLTSKKTIWTFPNQKVTDNCVIVCQTLEETNKYLKSSAYKVCTDFIDIKLASSQS